MRNKTNLAGTVAALVTLLSLTSNVIADETTDISKRIRDFYKNLRSRTQTVSTQMNPGMTNYDTKQIEIETPGGRINVLFTDDPTTTQEPDFAFVTTYGPNEKKSREEFFDDNLDGLVQKEPDFTAEDPFEGVDGYSLLNPDGLRLDILPELTPNQLNEANQRLLRYLMQVYVYTETPSGILVPIKPNDIGIQNPYDVPDAGMLNWQEHLPGFEAASLDVMFHDQLYDRMQLLRIDPARYAFSVHNDPSSKTIEQWMNDLGAVAVINGSYYTEKPYGHPVTPIMSNGELKGPSKWNTTNKANGAFLAEPVNPGDPLVKMVEFSDSTIVRLDQMGYNEVVTNYPILVDKDGISVAPYLLRPERRATRTFIAQDEQGRVILGNTERGFFDLGRLTKFLELDELGIEHALYLDGGPPSCMAAEAGDFSFLMYGSVEVNEKTPSTTNEFGVGLLTAYILQPIPTVIAVRGRQD